MIVYCRLRHSVMTEKVQVGARQEVQYGIFPKLLVQGKSKFVQTFYHLDHVQYMINDRSEGKTGFSYCTGSLGGRHVKHLNLI